MEQLLHSDANTCIIILAAGASIRLKQPKQLLQFKGKNLVQTAVEAATHSVCKPCIVVTGANADLVKQTLKGEPVIIVENKNWQQGMSSSIKCGMLKIPDNDTKAENVVIMLCDQPFVNAELLNKLVNEKTKSGKNIVACHYKNTLGVPALFNKKYFGFLRSLTEQEGAKKIISDNPDDVTFVNFDLGSIDIDTTDDYSLLINNLQDKQ